MGMGWEGRGGDAGLGLRLLCYYGLGTKRPRTLCGCICDKWAAFNGCLVSGCCATGRGSRWRGMSRDVALRQKVCDVACSWQKPHWHTDDTHHRTMRTKR